MSAAVERTWTPVELIRWTDGYLAEAGFEDSRLNAELLLAGVLRLKRLDLYLQFERPLSPEELAEYKVRLRRRLKREPLQYIAGEAGFRDLHLKVDRRALIPRPETELLVGAILDWARQRDSVDLVDIGTGTGAIAISLRVEGDFGRIVATEVSSDALQLARENADLAGIADQLDFRHGSLFDPVRGERFDVIVSNPPYIGERERDELQPEVVRWEPSSALFAGPDGLDVIRELVTGAPDHLEPGGLLALEIGATQAEAVSNLIRRAGVFDEPVVKRDLAGRDRMVLAELKTRRRAGTDND